MKGVLTCTSNILEVEDKNNILGAEEQKMLEIFKAWIKLDVKGILGNQLSHFGHLYSQWVTRSGKSDPYLHGTGKDNNSLALTIVDLGGLEKEKKGRKSTQ